MSRKLKNGCTKIPLNRFAHHFCDFLLVILCIGCRPCVALLILRHFCCEYFHESIKKMLTTKMFIRLLRQRFDEKRKARIYVAVFNVQFFGYNQFDSNNADSLNKLLYMMVQQYHTDTQCQSTFKNWLCTFRLWSSRFSVFLK